MSRASVLQERDQILGGIDVHREPCNFADAEGNFSASSLTRVPPETVPPEAGRDGIGRIS